MYEWLDYESKTRSVKIWHERNPVEVYFAKYRVDGYSKATDECWEFDGCFYHSCHPCNKSSNDPKVFQERLERTRGKTSIFERVTTFDTPCHYRV